MLNQPSNKTDETATQGKGNKLQIVLERAHQLHAHYRSPADYIRKDYNPNELQFIPPSPIFSFLHKYPTVASYANQFLYWDTSLCILMNRLSDRMSVATFFKIVSRLGDGWFWYAMLITAAVVGGIEQFHLVLATILTSVIGVGIYKILKVKTVRPRPYQVHQVIKLGERPLDVFSFPSGHTMQAVLFTSTLGAFFPFLWWIMAPFAILVALSRMILGLHYPTDVLVGAILGFSLSFLAPNLAPLMADVVTNVLSYFA